MAPKTTRLTKSDSELKSQFFALNSSADLAKLLQVPLNTLNFYIHRKSNYAIFLLNRAAGPPRRISIPVTPIKLIQRKLSQVLYAVYGSRYVVHGFARGRSIRSNALRHLGARWLLNFDLVSFFPSIHFGRVLGLFMGKPYNFPKPVALTLAQICCHEGTLPIGAPTSPIVANLICTKMDAELKALAWACSCTYTRYADDITVSTKATAFDKRIAEKNPEKRTWEIGEDVLKIVAGNGFAIQPLKTRVRGRHSSMEVTGVRINSGPNVSPSLYRQVRAMLHAIEKFGHAAAQEEHRKKYAQKQRKGDAPDLKAIVRGKIEFVGFVKGRDDRIYVDLLQRFQRIFHENAKPILIGSSTHESVIRQGIWLLKDKSEEHQGTAFAIQGGRLLTAAHNLDNIMFASRPGYDNKAYLVEEIAVNAELDLAEIRIPSFLPVQFRIDSTSPIGLAKRICVVGFPKFHDKDSVGFRFGNVVQERYYFAVKQGKADESTTVKHFVVDADIVKGNSGGPILDEHNRVVGVAVRGLDVPGKYNDDDQLSSFVPLHEWASAKAV